MGAGRRDQLIVVESRETSQDAVYGTRSSAWSEFRRMWAEVQDVLPSRAESVADGVSLQRRPARVRVLYMAGLGITSDMRIDVGGRKMRIVAGPAVKGRNEEWEMMVEQISTEGEAP